ncbi:ATP-dependent exoDNAse (exonuclease V) beta subunit [Gillisia sp. Hel_I_86]|uniref:UvrD-helicase domain-containing protein n=1 Tax=Gillisia sp. Hel_I_86 TaxID=1249981 RepID=UPI00119C8B19|nr:UvrD-helicase domain-containing protein [Gillisia sp. Hel_I_86]TVZ26369.1 ATP-dependent exoDNAse (exonuclease V) beta subunit [Gillisia sp. Hel_I_86]
MTNSNTFTIYNASAGSGKTFTLVKDYLVLLLNSSRDDAYKNILAITFTNKAVGEMKSRVILGLSSLAKEETPASSEPLLALLIKETNLKKDEIQKRSKRILKNILHNYAAFDISTIDRFTHKIIRTFAKDLGIPTNFEVELNVDLILQEAVDRVINRAGEEKELTKVLLKFTLDKTDDDKSWDIGRDLFSFSKLLIRENQQQYVQQLKGKNLQDFADFSEKVKLGIVLIEEDITGAANSFFDLLAKFDLTEKDFNGGYLFKYFIKIKNRNFIKLFGAKWQDKLEDSALYPQRLSDDKKAVLDQHQSEIAALFNSSKKAILKRDYLKAIDKSIIPLSLLSEISNEIDKIKKERSLVLISDFNPTIAKEINNQPVPFIYERLGERYKNYFIDEFQDTSEMQWTNIIPLADHNLNTIQSDSEPAANLTLVGDAKQSIYRFRGGKAEQFIDLCMAENPFQVKKEVIDLPSNYRSAKEVVEFNNSFFQYISNKFESDTYKSLFLKSAQEPIKQVGGYVNISFLKAKKKEEELELHPIKSLEIIKDLDEQGVSRSDICILTRTRKESFAIANYLNEQGVAIVSSESLLVSNSPEVRFINNLLSVSLNPHDKNIKWELLNYLVQKLEIKDAHKLILENLEKEHQGFFAWLTEHDIYFDLKKIQILSIYEAAEYIIRAFSLIKDSDAYLQFYLDFVFDSLNNKNIGISEFLELWSQKSEKLSILAPASNDAVQIMTIHKSKGLEFPIVIYPFANSALQDVSRESIWLPLPEGLNEIPIGYLKASKGMLDWGETEANAYQELLYKTEFDSINILYVAFTRAAQQLYIISNLDINAKGEINENKVSGLLIGFLKANHLWEDGQDIFEFGSKNIENYKASDVTSNLKNNRFFSSSTQNNAVQIMTKSGLLWGSLQEKAIIKGDLYHDIFSEIDTMEDMPSAIKKFTQDEDIPESELQELEQLISEVILHPELSEYYTAKSIVVKERNILSPNGEVLRPDRLNIKDKFVTIIDYKTGAFQKTHQLQMEQYENILNEMGYSVIKKILIYINTEVNLTFV